jgi:hypothetical protein
VNHAIIDASYGQIWFEDFDRALVGPSAPVHQHVNYKFWADHYFSARNSPEARASTRWHVKRLKDLGTHRKAIYPPPFERPTWDPALEEGEEDGVQYSFPAPGIPLLRQANRNITAPIALKAALALLNIQRTGHTHALFSNLQADRATFPFVPKSMASLSQYEATDVGGPTIESVINLIEIKPDETVVQFLHRMQNDQDNLTKYASAPWRDIMAALGPAGDMIPTITQSQIFNWVPGMGTTGTNPYENFRVLNAVVRPAVGIALNAGLGGEESSTMFLHVRGDGLTMEELGVMARDLEKITCWLTEERHWDAAVGAFAECL